MALPPWQTIYRYFHRLKLCQFWQNFNAELNGTWRTKLGRQAQPTAASLDSQSIKASETGSFHGYDAGKKIRGTKRHLLVDTLGLIMVVVVPSAGVQDFHGAKLVFERAKQLPVAKRLKVIWADGIYERECVETALAESGLNCRLEIIKRSDDQKGFVVLPKRWTVERTFSWLQHQRRLVRDYERKPESMEAFIFMAMCRLLVKRLVQSLD
jgi:putative transposase